MSRIPLTDLAAKYFRQNGYTLKENAVLEGFSGLLHKFDLIIRKGKGQRAVWIREWKRTVGINVVINMDRASEDVGFPKPIMISDKFSSHAKAYANRRSMTLLSRRQIRRMLG